MYVYVHEQSCPSLCNCMNCSLPGSSFSRQKNWNGLPFPSPGDLHNPGIETGSPALQADSLLSEPPGKPQISNIVHLFMCLLAICMSFSEKFLFRSSDHFLIALFAFLYLAVWVIYIFWKLIPWHLPVHRLSIHFVYGFICCAKVFKFNLALFVYFSICITLGDEYKKNFPAVYFSVLPMFSSRSFIVSGLTFRSLIHFVYDLYMILENVLSSIIYI